jgi:tungstate transport system ATP-binding protein
MPSLLPLQLDQLRFVSDRLELIKGISVTIDQPGISVVMGPNGAGKSLLLRLMHGLLEPSGGRVLWNGQVLHKSLHGRQSMVFQRPVMLRRSVLANLEFVLNRRKLPADQATCSELLARVGLEGLQARPARLLSGGEQQRLALARAIATRPEVLFMDEPTASLDPASTQMIESIVLDMARNGTKIFYVTHDVAQARRLADDVLFMNHGQLLEYAAAEVFFEQPQTDPARAYLAGKIVL